MIKLEVTIEGSPSMVFPVDKDEITLGSSRSCDISLPIMGVSRKHFVITRKNEDLFITDLGSTNGTFINEERLQVNVKTPLLAFFKISIGDRITISLLQDEKTGVFQRPSSLTESAPKKSEPETTTLKVDPQRFRGQQPLSKKSTNSNMSALFGVLILVAAIYWYANNDSEESHVSYETITKPAPPPSTRVREVIQDNKLIPPRELVSKNQMLDLLKDIKCTLDIEKYLCDIYRHRLSGQFGVVQVGTNLNILIDGSPYFKEAVETLLKKRSFNELTDHDKKEFNMNTERVSLALFLLEMPPYFSFEKLEGLKINIAFLSPTTADGTQHEVRFVAAFLPQSLKAVVSEFKPSSQKDIKKYGASAVANMAQYYSHF